MLDPLQLYILKAGFLKALGPDTVCRSYGTAGA
jgi:hypothetical protein